MSLTLGQLVILLQVAEPLFGGGDVVALVLRDVLLAGRFELLQVLVGDVFRQVAEQRAVLRHGLVTGREKRKKGEKFEIMLSCNDGSAKEQNLQR